MQISEVLDWINDAQKWFSTGRLSSLLKKICIRRFGTTRAFVFPAETRFAGKLLQMKRFSLLKDALIELVQSEEYVNFNFDNDSFAPRITDRAVWTLIERILKAAGPILLLIRLADIRGPTLSKLKGTLDYIGKKMKNSGEDTLEDKISTAFHTRAPELESDIANAAYVLDQQFVNKSRSASTEVMASFWRVARTVLRISDDREWRKIRSKMVSELADFRMQTGGFDLEDYDVEDTCAFWVVAGAHAPTLKQVAVCITPLPCSSGEAERNWAEVKHNMVKKRNRLSRAKVEKMVFVRRFIRLKQTLFERADDDSKKWLQELLQNAMAPDSAESDSELSESDEAVSSVFQDRIEPGEQGKINGKEPGKPRIPLGELKKDKVAQSWLFEKYYSMCFCDKNPFGGPDDPDLSDEEKFEHRVITNIGWLRLEGYAVCTKIYGNPERQSMEKYHINETLHDMIRSSPHNTKKMASEMNTSDYPTHE